MQSLSEDRALELLRHCFGDVSRDYFWESIEHIEWSSDRSVDQFLPEESYDVVFDPNCGTTFSRLAAARYFGRDDMPLGYHLTRTELLDMSRQSWIANADFYMIGSSGSLCALRTHEDPDLEYGFWIPKTSG
jgi:hypothetical protein